MLLALKKNIVFSHYIFFHLIHVYVWWTLKNIAKELRMTLVLSVIYECWAPSSASLLQSQGPYASQRAAKISPPPRTSAQSLCSASHSTFTHLENITTKKHLVDMNQFWLEMQLPDSHKTSEQTRSSLASHIASCLCLPHTITQLKVVICFGVFTTAHTFLANHLNGI